MGRFLEGNVPLLSPSPSLSFFSLLRSKTTVGRVLTKEAGVCLGTHYLMPGKLSELAGQGYWRLFSPLPMWVGPETNGLRGWLNEQRGEETILVVRT